MLSLEVRFNGELKATCRADGLDNVFAHVRAARKSKESGDYDIRIECSGSKAVDADTYEVIKWVSALIELGDEVSLRFVETP